jgi:hypothetical protein
VLAVVLCSVSGLGSSSTATGATSDKASGGDSFVAAGGGVHAFNSGFRSAVESDLSTASVTPDGARYSYSHPQPGTVVVAAPQTSGVNEREFFWEGTSPDEPDATVCGTFSTGHGIDQQGIVLRLNDANGTMKAITVTRNVIFSDSQAFNFHLWNTSDADHPFTLFGQTILPFLPFSPAVYPLNMCARTVTATNQTQFVVWTAGQKQPPWGDPVQGGEATIPVGSPSIGREGFFAGHLIAGTNMVLTDLSIDGQPL